MSQKINMKREDQIKLQELINKKQMWIQKAVNEINANGTDEGYKRAITYINLDAGINIQLEKMLSEYCPEEEIVVPKKEIDDIDESAYEDVNTEDEQDNV